jgi:hypothetical protein
MHAAERELRAAFERARTEQAEREPVLRGLHRGLKAALGEDAAAAAVAAARAAEDEHARPAAAPDVQA